MKTNTSLETLTSNIHAAFKNLKQGDATINPLGELAYFEQIKREYNSNIKQTTNLILSKLLEELAIDEPDNAKLLRGRFKHGKSVQDMADQLGILQPKAFIQQKKALEQVAILLLAKEQQTIKKHTTTCIARLPTLFYSKLIGADTYQKQLINLITKSGTPWVISIAGIGGIGKTALVYNVTQQLILQQAFVDFGWLSVRNYKSALNGVIKIEDIFKLTPKNLETRLIKQLILKNTTTDIEITKEHTQQLSHKLKQAPHLIVLDNLHSTDNIEDILPFLYKLCKPTKFLLTARKKLSFSPLYHFELSELNEAEAISFFKQEAELRNLPILSTVTNDDLKQVVDIVGGNPLAIQLIVGLTQIFELSAILDNLIKVQGDTIEAFYHFIYHHSWTLLDDISRQILLSMKDVNEEGCTLEALIDQHKFSKSSINNALILLVALNLVYYNDENGKRKYTIHKLTRTFLQEQANRC